MANSGTVTAGSAALASQYNNLRDDVLNVSTGHTHTGASENGAKVAATGVSSGTAALGAVLTADGSGAAAFLALAAAGADVQEFTASGSWVKPAGKSAVYVFAIGGGGGGGAGSRVDGVASGGFSGSGAAHAAHWLKASDLAGTVTVTIASGGAGGTAPASSTATYDGVAGVNGGNTTFGTAVRAFGGNGGMSKTDFSAGNEPYGVGGAEWGRKPAQLGGTAGGTDDDVNTTRQQTTTFNLSLLMSGGRGVDHSHNATRCFLRTAAGGSGGIQAGSTGYGGGAGGRGFGSGATVPSGGNGSGNPGAGSNGSAGSVCTIGFGHGGGGGGAGVYGNGGNGGAGYRGGGGGGGGASLSGGGTATISGAGGVGGDGYILVVSV